MYAHFETLLAQPGKILKLDDTNFPTKVNPSRKYPPCIVDTSNLFDEDGDPVFTAEAPSEPATPTTYHQSKLSEKIPVPSTSCFALRFRG